MNASNPHVAHATSSASSPRTNISTTTSGSGTSHPSRIRPRDWISIGVYAALYMVLVYACGMLGYLPFLYPFCGVLYGLLCQTPVLLLVSKVRRFGALTILGLLSGLIVGFGIPAVAGAGLVAGLVADALVALGRYANRAALIVACGVLNLMWFASYAMLFLNRDSMMAGIAEAYGGDYALQVSRLLPQWSAFAMPIAMIAAGCLGAWIALRLLRKHFEKAGLVAGSRRPARSPGGTAVG